jgi:hypothetical protein
MAVFSFRDARCNERQKTVYDRQLSSVGVVFVDLCALIAGTPRRLVAIGMGFLGICIALYSAVRLYRYLGHS